MTRYAYVRKDKNGLEMIQSDNECSFWIFCFEDIYPSFVIATLKIWRLVREKKAGFQGYPKTKGRQRTEHSITRAYAEHATLVAPKMPRRPSLPAS